MIRMSSMALVAAAALVAASAGAQSARQGSGPVTGDAASGFSQGNAFAEPTGELMYANVCAGCHMPGGAGAVGAGFYPALAKNEKLASNAYPVMVLLQGLNGMPPLGDQMTDQQVADVVNYVRTHFGNRYRDAVTAADVKSMR